MDISDEYILMCKKAQEIQYWKYEQKFIESDFVYTGKKVRVIGHDFLPVYQLFQKGSDYVRFAMMKALSVFVYEQEVPTDRLTIKDGEYIVEELANAIWLPRQDQLQEMIEYLTDYDFELTSNGTEWFLRYTAILRNLDRERIEGEIEYATSMEQLWLAFVMKEKYQKMWNGKEWINED
jgi:hypothetical protein